MRVVFVLVLAVLIVSLVLLITFAPAPSRLRKDRKIRRRARVIERSLSAQQLEKWLSK